MSWQSDERQIDPLDVEWIPVEGITVEASESGARFRQYRSGRPSPIAANLPWLRWKHKTVTLWATPEDARGALVDLERHAHPRDLDGALIFRLLHQATTKKRAYRARRSNAGGIAIASTKEGAIALLADLKWYSRASRSDPKAILQSVAATFLRLAIEAAQSRRQYIRQCVEDAARLYAPWIYRFAYGVTSPHKTPDPNDLRLLGRILTAAEKAGYSRESFYSTHTPPRLLSWPLQAFLFELCVGIRNRGNWWADSGWSSPFELMQRELGRKRERGSLEQKLTGFYKLFLGKDWPTVVGRDDPNQHAAANGAPAPIMRALRQLRA